MYFNITSAFVIISVFLSLTLANNLLKFDCLPEGGNKTQCLQRDCIWEVVEEVRKYLQNQSNQNECVLFLFPQVGINNLILGRCTKLKPRKLYFLHGADTTFFLT